MRARLPEEQDFLVDYLHRIQKTQKKLKTGADDGILRIVEYGYKNGYSTAEIGYNLATAGHETAEWYQPIREGATRFGPQYTDLQAQAAVRAAMQKGLIKNNYVQLINGNSYYGRGLVQITWIDNYKKYEALTGKPLVKQPDLALDWDTALFIMYDGIHNGRFRNRKFSDYVRPGTVPTHHVMSAARDIVNGDGAKYGASIGRAALDWYIVLEDHDQALRNAYAPRSAGFIAFLLALLKGFKK